MYPLFYAALAFAAGIAVAPAHGVSLRWLCIVSLLAAGVAIFRRTRAAALLLLAALLGNGWAAHSLTQPPPVAPLVTAMEQLHVSSHQPVEIAGYLRDTPELVGDYLRCDLEAFAITVGERGLPAQGGVRLFAAQHQHDYAPSLGAAAIPAVSTNAALVTQLTALAAGTAIRAQVYLRHPSGFRDPGVVDTSRLLGEQGVDLFASVKSVVLLQAGGGGAGLRWRARLWAALSFYIDALAPPDDAAWRRLERSAGPLPSVDARPPATNGSDSEQKAATPPTHGRSNALLRAMLLGDTARLDPDLRRTLQIDGVYHIVVIAGLHIGVLAAAFFLFFGRLPLDRLWLRGGILALLAGYVWLISGRTPTQRALLMLGLYLAAASWYRERRPLNAVGFAALTLLIWRPLDLFAAGFQMSFVAATLLAGVAVPLLEATSRPLIMASRELADVGRDERFSPRLAQFRIDLRMLATRLASLWRPLGWRVMPGLLRLLIRFADVLVVSLVLQIGMEPLMLVYFHRANPWSPVVNALVVPLVSLIIPVAWLSVAVSALVAPLARIAAPPLLWLCSLTLHISERAALLPWADRRVPTPPPWALVMFAIAVAVWLIVSLAFPQARQKGAAPPAPRDWARYQRLALGWSAVVFAALVLALVPFPPRLAKGTLSVVFLDVGQGDAIFVAFPSGKTMLVDAGPRAPIDTGEEVVSPFLWSKGLRRLDAVVLTHGHSDHLGGLPAVMRNFHPNELWITATLPREPEVVAVLRAAIAAGVRIQPRHRGERFLIDDVYVDVLLPPAWYRAGALASNDDSLVMRLRRGRSAVLLEGDAEAGGESLMIEDGLPHVDVLKVGHHGSATSSTPALLAAAHPFIAVISAGRDNRYGHPAPAVVERLRQSGAAVFRTDRDGAIECRFEPSLASVWLFRRYGEAVNGPELRAVSTEAIGRVQVAPLSAPALALRRRLETP